MKTNTMITIIGVVIIASVAGAISIYVFAPMTGPTYTPKTVYITEQDNNTTITVLAGDSINLTLKDYGDGGYQWNITSIDEQILRLDNNFTWGSSGMLGDFGNDTWIFTTIDGRETTLRLECKQPWDGGNTTATMTIIIRFGYRL
ncbi:MAG: protease inhibitor I42 family protein [Methanobacteriota archaeon]